MIIFCCECSADVNARLTDGREIYPHRPDLAGFPFWKCDTCKNFVGCHHKTKSRTAPLGCIPNDAIKSARRHIHALIDPAWKSGKMKRGAIYQHLSAEIGKPYHTAEIRTIEEARKIYLAAKRFIQA